MISSSFSCCLCRRPELSEGEDIRLEGRSDIQTKDRLQGKTDGCSPRGVFVMERFTVHYNKEGLNEQTDDEIFTLSI